MTDAVADIEFFQQQMRLLEQRLYDAERVIEDRDHTIDRLEREIENLRRHAIEVRPITSGPRSSPKSSSTACAAGRGRAGRRSSTAFDRLLSETRP